MSAMMPRGTSPGCHENVMMRSGRKGLEYLVPARLNFGNGNNHDAETVAVPARTVNEAAS